jgi:type IV secretion system protein TrbC
MRHKLFFLFSVLLLAAAGTAHATQAAAAGLPWEAPITTLSNSVSGPVAYGCSLVGLVGAGGSLIFLGGQINEFLRIVLFIVMVIAFIIAGKNTMTAFGWGAGATVTGSQIEHVERANGSA